METINFDFLSNYPDSIPIIAQWHQDEWNHISPDLTTDLRIQLYSSYPSCVSVPGCILAHTDGQAIGSASLVKYDMETHHDLSPWLASLYVDKKYRCQGIATQLIDKILDQARQLLIKKLYLFTPDQTEFYRKRGWQLLESVEYHNESVDIMFYDIEQINKD